MDILITNNGTHPPDVWAELTSNQILDLVHIEEGASSPQAVAARQLKRALLPQLVAALTEEYAECQGHEKAQCNKGAEKRLHSKQHDVKDHIESGVSKVAAIVAGTMFADHFQKPEVIEHVGHLIGQHAVNIQHIERSHAVTSKKEA